LERKEYLNQLAGNEKINNPKDATKQSLSAFSFVPKRQSWRNASRQG